MAARALGQGVYLDDNDTEMGFKMLITKYPEIKLLIFDFPWDMEVRKILNVFMCLKTLKSEITFLPGIQSTRKHFSSIFENQLLLGDFNMTANNKVLSIFL